jgi:hypothetical protein
MDFKFAVGQLVQYKPANGRLRRCLIVRRMPSKEGQFDFRYRIKEDLQPFERTVFECELDALNKIEGLYDFLAVSDRRRR